MFGKITKWFRGLFPAADSSSNQVSAKSNSVPARPIARIEDHNSRNRARSGFFSDVQGNLTPVSAGDREQIKSSKGEDFRGRVLTSGSQVPESASYVSDGENLIRKRSTSVPPKHQTAQSVPVTSRTTTRTFLSDEPVFANTTFIPVPVTDVIVESPAVVVQDTDYFTPDIFESRRRFDPEPVYADPVPSSSDVTADTSSSYADNVPASSYASDSSTASYDSTPSADYASSYDSGSSSTSYDSSSSSDSSSSYDSGSSDSSSSSSDY